MRIGVIDIGSNSIRLMLSEDGRTLYKKIIITKLGEGISLTKVLKTEAIIRTAEAIKILKDKALEDGAIKVLAFATAAVRASQNKQYFLDYVKKYADIEIEIISGEKEANIGLNGALNGKHTGGIIDIGGASTEITVKKDDNIIYTYSLDIGTVRLLDLCAQDKDRLLKLIREKIKEYNKVPITEFYGIGGTATSALAVILELEPYDPKITDGYILNFDKVSKLSDKLFTLSLQQKTLLKGLQKGRAEVIAGGVLLLKEIMQYLGLKYITISEKDNLEGYLMNYLEKL